MENQIVRKNKAFAPGNCPVVYCMNIIGGKWKPSVIHLIRNQQNRYSILLKSIPEISKQTLTNQLRELEADGIIKRTIFPEIPPHVEYHITDLGQTLLPIIDSMYSWGYQHMTPDKKGYCDVL